MAITKKLLLAFTLLVATYPALSQTRSDYDSIVNRFKDFYNNRGYDSIFNMLSPRIQGLMSLEKTRVTFHDLYFQIEDFLHFEFTKEDNKLSYYKTRFHHKTLTLIISLNSDKKIETFRFMPYLGDSVQSNIVYKAPEGSIYGTLVMPANIKGKVPVVLVIAGSGATDRNGNQTGITSNAYQMIADSLKNYGIASVRYDKRGVGESAAIVKTESELLFSNMVDDAAGFVHMLQNDSRFSKVIVLGHSEGSLIGMIAVAREKAAALISVAGTSERADKTIKKQLFEQSPTVAKYAIPLLDSLVKGYTVQKADPSLNYLFRPTIQPYMRSWLKYEPAVEIKKVKAPILILHGTTDIQVGKAHAEMLKKANPAASLKYITGMNHVLKEAPADRTENLDTYTSPELPLCKGFIPQVVKFVKGLDAKKVTPKPIKK
jgi:alpha-beta hydrolase superfamily lysophospholipase